MTRYGYSRLDYWGAFVLIDCDFQQSMMTILAIVNASKEGQIESKMMKSRQMEEIREARRKEAEARQEQRKSKLVCKPYNQMLDDRADNEVGGDQRFTAQEKEEEARCRSGYRTLRHHPQDLERRQIWP